MKKHILLFFLLAFNLYSIVFAQWIRQGLGFETQTGIPGNISISTPDIAWVEFQSSVHIPLSYCLTTDGGNNWNIIQIPGYPDYDCWKIESYGNNLAWILANDAPDQIFLKTTNQGLNWFEIGGTTFDTVSILDIQFFNNQEGIVAGMTKPPDIDFFFANTQDGGLTWSVVNNNNIPNPINNDFIKPWPRRNAYGDVIYFLTLENRILKSIDKGQQWSMHNTPLTNFSLSAGKVGLVFMDSINGLFYSQKALFYHTYNGGLNWQNFSPTGPVYEYISYVPGTYRTLVSSGSTLKNSTLNSGCSFSTDGGHTWTGYPEFEGSTTEDNSFYNTTTGWTGCRTLGPNSPDNGIFKFTGVFSEILETDPRLGGITMYPNPSGGKIKAIVIGFEGEEVHFTLCNNLGQAVFSEEFLQDHGQSEKQFDFSALPGGIYFAVFSTGKSVMTKLVVLE
jgi:hypothetical protein